MRISPTKCTRLHIFPPVFKNFSGVTPSDHELAKGQAPFLDPPCWRASTVPHFQSFRARYGRYRGTPTERPFTRFLRWTIQNSWRLMSNFCIIKHNKLQKKIKCQNKCDLGNNVSGVGGSANPHDSTDEHFSMLFNMYAMRMKKNTEIRQICRFHGTSKS